jgi:hypothetical protein
LTRLVLYWRAEHDWNGVIMRRAVGTVLLAAVLGLAGCRGSSHHPGVATAGGGAHGASASPTASVDPEEAQRQFTQCMREHGVDVPDPDTGQSGGGGVRIQASAGSKVEAALQACQKYLPAGKLSSPNPQQLEQAREFAKCMRDHGVDIPDPDPNGGGMQVHKGTGGDGDPGISPDDPAFKAAMEACQGKLPGNVKTETANGGGR